jgi:hypothetical protein
VGVAVLHDERQTDRQTDMTKPVVTSHNNAANMSKNGRHTKFIQKNACQAGRHNDIPLQFLVADRK